MTTKKQLLDRYVEEWRELLKRDMVGHQQYLLNAYEVSKQIAELIKKNIFADREICRALKKILDETRARHLISMQEVGVGLVKRGAAQIRRGEKGGSCAHFLYVATVKEKEDKKDLLKWSLKAKAGMREFKKRVNEKRDEERRAAKKVVGISPRRPTIVIKQLDHTAEQLLGLINEVASKEFLSSIDTMDSIRRKNAKSPIDSAMRNLRKIERDVQNSLACLRQGKSRLGTG